jgi:uncharacterized protein (TIGR03437 family)
VRQTILLAWVLFGSLADGQSIVSAYVTYRVGDAAPSPLLYQIPTSAFAPAPGPISLVLTQPLAWLAASLTSTLAPSTLTLTFNPAEMPSPGTWSSNEGPISPAPYSTCATINSSNPLGIVARQDWCVYLTVIDSTTPAIISVLNAASFATVPLPTNGSPPALGPSVSPGEIVSIFGSALGALAPASLQVSPTGAVATELEGVQVLFDGIAAPLTYVSATQINCIVPYAIAPGMVPGNIIPIDIEYSGQVLSLLMPGRLSPSLSPIASTSGIFTATGTGAGQAAALNSDNSVNSVSNPAPAGSAVQIFMTGEGQTSPAGVTGSVTCFSGCAADNSIPGPVAKVSATVNGQAASVAFAGEAPGLVAGVAQVNVVIPANTPSGPATLSISVGATLTQAEVTIAVK